MTDILDRPLDQLALHGIRLQHDQFQLLRQRIALGVLDSGR